MERRWQVELCESDSRLREGRLLRSSNWSWSLTACMRKEAVQAASRPAAVQTLIEKPYRKPLAEHLPRQIELHEPACTCPNCGGGLRKLGKDVTEVLDYVPASFKVVRHVRPKLSCRVCEMIVQLPMPSLPIERGKPGPGLLDHALVAKYADHLPLYRQSGILDLPGKNGVPCV